MKLGLNKQQVFSSVKYQQERKLLKSIRIINDRNTLKVLNREEIIAYRLPLHEAILRKLNTDGFTNSSNYLQQLIDFQDSYRNDAGEDTIIWQRPRLIYQQKILEHLADNLRKAEEAHFISKTQIEIDIFLNLATEFCFGDENWWWLGHQILFITQKTCEFYIEDRGKRLALLNYIFGRFLFEKVIEPRMALEYLKIARKISKEMSWNINVLFPATNATVFSQACTLIHKIRMIQAKSVVQKDPKNTLKLCEKARKRALEGCYYKGVIDSYILRGNCEMALFDSENAIKSFKKALEILKEHNNVDQKCEILKNLGIAYLKHGSLNYALAILHKLNDFAEQMEKMEYIAQAHKYLGKYYLKEGTARKATPLLMKAMRIFRQVGFNEEAVKTMHLTAISVGIELMPTFSEIIKKSDSKFSSHHKEHLRKLIRWKDFRESFWNDSEFSQLSIASNQTDDKCISLSETEIVMDMPEVDDLDFEELLGITGLEKTDVSYVEDKISTNIECSK